MNFGRIRFTGRALPVLAAALSSIAGCKTPVPPVETTVARAHHDNDYGHYESAATALQPIVDATPGVWQVEYEYGRAQMGLGNLEVARRAFERANARVPTNLEIIFALADCYAAQKDSAKLYELLRNAGTQLRSSEAWVRLATAADRVGDPDTAVQSIRAAIEIDDGFDVRRTTECYWVASQIEERYGTQEEAVRRLRQAYGVNAEDPRVRAALQKAGVPFDGTTALPPGV